MTRKRKAIAISLCLASSLLGLCALFQLHLLCLKMKAKQESLRRSEIARKRRARKNRTNWESFSSSVNDSHFRRMFRMPRDCFENLCNVIEGRVGERIFCSEKFIKKQLVDGKGKLANIFRAHQKTSGGFVCGEVRLAITLRMLAGGSYLDISYVFGVSYNHAYKIFNHVLKYWLCNDSVYKYKLFDILKNEEAMYDIAKFFAKGRSGGILSGVIGALDGWLVKIQCPSLKRDGVSGSGGYFSRKGFFALNVLVIVDKHKRVLWRSIGARGSEHDSSAFKATKLYETLVDLAFQADGKTHCNEFNIPFYIIGDSAFGSSPFLVVPFDNTLPGSAEDAFNFIHSSSRISVECAFGEIDSRWGIFWRPLRTNLCNHKFVIDACMRLHNFIIDHRESKSSSLLYQTDNQFFSAECLQFITANPEEIVGTFGNGRIGRDRGRPSNIEGKFVRHYLDLDYTQRNCWLQHHPNPVDLPQRPWYFQRRVPLP